MTVTGTLLPARGVGAFGAVPASRLAVFAAPDAALLSPACEAAAAGEDSAARVKLLPRLATPAMRCPVPALLLLLAVPGREPGCRGGVRGIKRCVAG